MKIKSSRTQEFTILLELSEQEAGALHDIVGYGYKAFIEVFKDRLGKSYIERHEEGCKSLFETISQEMPKHLTKFKQAREIFNSKTTQPCKK